MELTIVMPCLNEAETVATCVRKAMGFLAESGIDGEVVVADNGSTDGSQRLATDAGARVVAIKDKGYGNALMGGIAAARGKYVIMGDADDSYDFTSLMPFVTELRKGYDLVMGNRFKGGIEPGAMPRLHKYLGNPVLSFIGRLFFPSAIGDFHCGLRGFSKEGALALGLQATGMEFASEMVVKATLVGPEDHRGPHHAEEGRPVPPAAPAVLAGRLAAPAVPAAVQPALAVLRARPGAVPARPHRRGGHRGRPAQHRERDVRRRHAGRRERHGGDRLPGGLVLAVHPGLRGSRGLLAEGAGVQRLLGRLSLERGLLLGLAIGLAGLGGLIFSIVNWGGSGFHNLNYEHALRSMIPSATALIVSCQLILGTFFLSILGIKQTRHVSGGSAVEVNDSQPSATAH